MASAPGRSHRLPGEETEEQGKSDKTQDSIRYPLNAILASTKTEIANVNKYPVTINVWLSLIFKLKYTVPF
jgi:hypothetical protein